MSSHQPCERKEPIHLAKLLCFPVHLQTRAAEVAAVVAEPPDAGYSTSSLPSSCPVQVPIGCGFFTYSKLIVSLLPSEAGPSLTSRLGAWKKALKLLESIHRRAAEVEKGLESEVCAHGQQGKTAAPF